MDLFVRKDTKTSQPINIEKVEERYGGKFIGDFCLKNKSGSWSEETAAVFYQPNPDVGLGHTHYFGVFSRGDSFYITCGDSAFEEPIVGVVANNGEVVYSRYRHDFTYSTDNSVWIDGGRDYTRSGGSPNGFVKLVINEDKLTIVPESLGQ